MLTERQQEIHFKKLLNEESNTKCADCKSKGATWASLGFGVFICITCSGIHRSFGMHITRVRSTKLDSWTKEDAKLLEIIGNNIANLYWEDGLREFPSLDGSFSDFIRKKYEMKLYVKKNVEDPVSYVEKRNYEVKSAALKNYYLTAKDAKTPVKVQQKKNKFNLKINTQSKKTENNNDVDFLHLDETLQKPQNNKKEENDFLNLNLTNNIQNEQKKPAPTFDLDLLENTQNLTNFQKSYPKKDDFDFDLLDKQKPKINNKAKSRHDDFFIDLSEDVNPHHRTHSSNLENVHHNTNIFNIRHLNIYNNNTPHSQNQPNNHFHLKKDFDKYSAFDLYKHF